METENLAAATADEIWETGYSVIPQVLSSDLVTLVVNQCRAAAARFGGLQVTSESAAAVHGVGNIALVHNLHNKHEVFRELIFHPLVDAVASIVLSAGSYQDREPYQLALSQARGLTGPHPAQQLHIDSYLPGLPYVLVLQAAWILSELSPGSGATQFVAGSHRRRDFASNGVDYPTVAVDAPPGSLVLFDGGLWHGSAEKTTTEERWAIFNRYSRWFMRPSFDLTRNTPRDVFDSLDDHQRDILGFRFRAPRDEFTRITRISPRPEFSNGYRLPEEPIADGD